MLLADGSAMRCCDVVEILACAQLGHHAQDLFGNLVKTSLYKDESSTIDWTWSVEACAYVNLTKLIVVPQMAQRTPRIRRLYYYF